MSSLPDMDRDDWSRFTLRQRLTRYGSLIVTLLVIAWSVTSIDVIWWSTTTCCDCSCFDAKS